MAKAAKQDEPKKEKHIVVEPFRNINNYDEIYKAGEDVSHFAPERLEPLVGIGIVKKVTE